MAIDTRESVAEQIESFVRTQFRVRREDPRFSRSQPLFDLGYVDSIGVLELLDFITQRFGIQVPDEALLSDEFTTIDGMATVIVRLRDSRR